MVYKYLLGQIPASDLFFWVGFIYCFCFFFLFSFKEKLYGLFFMDGIQLPTEPLQGGTLLFTTELPPILSFSKKLLPTIFQFLHIDSKFWCFVLACNFTKSNTPPRVFFTFLKLYKWYQIAQNIIV